MLTFVKIPALTPNMSEYFSNKWLYCFCLILWFVFFFSLYVHSFKQMLCFSSCLAGRTPVTSLDRYKGSAVHLFILFLSHLRLTSSLPFGLMLNEVCSVSPGFRPNPDCIYSFYILASTLARGVGGVWEGRRIKTGGRWEEVMGREREREKWETGKRRDETQIYGRGGSLN